MPNWTVRTRERNIEENDHECRGDRLMSLCMAGMMPCRFSGEVFIKESAAQRINSTNKQYFYSYKLDCVAKETAFLKSIDLRYKSVP